MKLMLLFLRLMSLRSSERGLKYYVKYLTPVVEKSLRSSERGLKCTIFGSNFGKCIVAPFVGAWIEISRVIDPQSTVVSLRSSERGLK